MLEIRDVASSNLPDAARLCLAGKTLDDRPRAFTKDVERESMRCKLSLLAARLGAGAMAHAAYRDGLLVGYVEHHAIETSLAPLVGEGCRVIHCVRVPETPERAEVEPALVEHAMKQFPASRGLAVLAREKSWTPCGFEEIAREASEIQAVERALWWRPIAGGAPPVFAKIQRKFARIDGKVRVDLFASDRCPWDRFVFDMVRGVASRMKNEAVVFETDCNQRANVLAAGVACGVAIDGEFQPWVRPHRLPDERMIRRRIEDAE